MNTTTLYRTDFIENETGTLFNDMLIELGLADNYEQAKEIDVIEISSVLIQED
jgi:hypothetical protein